ncbi:MAG: futalosine hydrolase [Planctomycetes bacterium]|nr:futalosine hydrolase [Planctomycetota bacterium]
MRPPPGSPTLILIPTAVEERRLEDQGGFDAGLGIVALCGFGPIAAAARTAELLATLRPARVVLVGIAGTFDPELLPLGRALAFDAVAVEGIGAGEGRELAGPAALGFPQWPGSGGAEAIHDRIVLAARREFDPSVLHDPALLRDAARTALLLSTCAASASPAQAALRRERFPEALAEDMEGFAVALSCALLGVPCHIVRGISNVVGDRDPGRWRIPAALAAARLCALELLRREG